MKQSTPRVTLAQVAKAAGVDVPTASRILNGKAEGCRISEGRVKAVTEVACRLHYQPNGIARAMRRGSFGAVGLLRSTESSAATMTHTVLWSIEQALLVRDVHLVMGQIPDERLVGQSQWPRILREWSVDGLLINYTSHAPQAMDDLLSRGSIPAIWINVKLPANAVHPDDFAATRVATERLLACGHRRIAYLGPTPDGDRHYSLRDRRDGYLAAMRAASCTPILLVSKPDNDFGATVVADALGGTEKPSAFVTYGPAETVSVVVTALMRGMAFPRDLSLIGVQEDQSPIGGIHVTARGIPSFDMGTEAVNSLFRRLLNPRMPEPSLALPFLDFEGRTCGAFSDAK